MSVQRVDKADIPQEAKRHGIPIFECRGFIRIRGKRWHVGTMTKMRARGNRGVCMKPDKRNGGDGYIAISTHLASDSPMYRETIIHETLHAAPPNATERQVRLAAKSVRQALEKMG